LGVRGIVISPDDEILLVRQRLCFGWHFPGGGVEVGEAFVESLTRELEEEGRIAIEGRPVLHGLFFNTQTSKRDPRRGLRCSELSSLRANVSPIGKSPRLAFSLARRCRRERRGRLEQGSPRSSMPLRLSESLVTKSGRLARALAT